MGLRRGKFGGVHIICKEERWWRLFWRIREKGKTLLLFFCLYFFGGYKIPSFYDNEWNFFTFVVLGTLDNEGHGALYGEFRRYFFCFVCMVGIFK
jgi:hypothetical protein